MQSYIVHQTPLEHINLILEPTPNEGALFLGDIIVLLKPQLLEKHGIAAVVSCLNEREIENARLPSHIPRLWIPSHDAADFSLFEHFTNVRNFIDKARKNRQNVLVHCHAGVSRSATFVCAYIMDTLNLNSSEALQFVKNRRKRIRPNEGFLSQLANYSNNRTGLARANSMELLPDSKEELPTPQEQSQISNKTSDTMKGSIAGKVIEERPERIQEAVKSMTSVHQPQIQAFNNTVSLPRPADNYNYTSPSPSFIPRHYSSENLEEDRNSHLPQQQMKSMSSLPDPQPLGRSLVVDSNLQQKFINRHQQGYPNQSNGFGAYNRPRIMFQAPPHPAQHQFSPQFQQKGVQNRPLTFQQPYSTPNLPSPLVDVREPTETRQQFWTPKKVKNQPEGPSTYAYTVQPEVFQGLVNQKIEKNLFPSFQSQRQGTVNSVQKISLSGLLLGRKPQEETQRRNPVSVASMSNFEQLERDYRR